MRQTWSQECERNYKPEYMPSINEVNTYVKVRKFPDPPKFVMLEYSLQTEASIPSIVEIELYQTWFILTLIKGTIQCFDLKIDLVRSNIMFDPWSFLQFVPPFS